MSKDKRPYPQDGNREGGLPEQKKPRLSFSSVVMEALKVESLHKLWPLLEPLFRKVVGEEVERALQNFTPKVGPRVSPKRIQGPDERNLQLQFKSKLALPLFTGSKVEGEDGSGIQVALVDANTGKVVSDGEESCAKLEIVVLQGDFIADDEESWPQAEFENFMVKERDGKRPLLTGDLFVTLKDGLGTLGEFQFTDNSSWIRSRKFRLGVMVAPGYCEGVRVREAKTESFTVKDHRGELYKKHYPPALQDEVWRLDRIGKDGAFHKRLSKEGIETVEQFLRLLVMHPLKLRNALGNGMSNKMWEGTVEHAMTCPLNSNLYVYRPGGNLEIIFNNIFQLVGLIVSNTYRAIDSLEESERVYVEKLAKVAHEKWQTDVQEYDGEALIRANPSLRGVNMPMVESSARGQALGGSDVQTQDTRTTQTQQPQQSLPSTQSALSTYHLSSKIPAGSSVPGNGVGGSQAYTPEPTMRVSQSFPTQANQPLPDQHIMGSGPNINGPSQQVTLASSSNLGPSEDSPGLATGLVLASPQNAMIPAGSLALPPMTPSLMSLYPDTNDWRPYQRSDSNPWGSLQGFNDDARGQGILSQDELVPYASMVYPDNYANYGGYWQDDSAYTYNSPPMWNMGEQRPRHNNAKFGWSKLKAALRWGIFKPRPNPPVRRAHLEEHEE
ncbi:unnamed protein product [Sphagnum tenellum]